MKTFLITSLILLNFGSCQIEKFVIIEKDSLKSAFILNSSSTFKGYFYLGTDNDFHYFESRWQLQKDKYFKIRKEELKVIEPHDFREKEVKIDLFDSTKTIFGKNEYYTLYIVDK